MYNTWHTHTLTFLTHSAYYTVWSLLCTNKDMEGEEEFSILKKSEIPNLLQDDFSSHSEQTFLTELSEEIISSKLQESQELEIEDRVLEQHEKQKLFKKDVDFRQTLINEHSFESISEYKEHDGQINNGYIRLLDIFACLGLAMVILDFVSFIL